MGHGAHNSNGAAHTVGLMGRRSRGRAVRPDLLGGAVPAWRRRRSGLARPDAAQPDGWCASTAELEELIGLLVSPGVLPIIRELAAAGRRGCRNLSAAICPPLDAHTLGTALDRLTAFGLIVISYTDRAPAQCPQVDCALTASGENLLAPLAGFATWYERNHDQFAPHRPAAESADLASVPVDASRHERTASDAPSRDPRRAHRRERGDQLTNLPWPPRAPA